MQRLPESLVPNEYSVLQAEKRASPRFLDLTETNPTRVGLDYPEEEIRETLARAEIFPYEPHPRGGVPARESVAGACGVGPERIWLTSGTSEAFSYLAKLLTEPGDEIAIPRPSYPLFDHLLRMEGVRAAPYLLAHAEGWFIDFGSLEAAVGPRTKAVVVVHPNNPTGHFVRAAEMDSLRRFAVERGLALIVDEVFLDFPLEGAERPRSFTADPWPVPTLVLGGLSKRLGLPQLKLSWIISCGPENREIDRRLDWISDLYLSVGTAVQRALPALMGLSKRLTPLILERIQRNHDFLRTRSGVIRGLPSEGGWSAVLIADVSDEEQWGIDLLRERSVSVHPGYFFDLPFRSSAVVSLLPEPGRFREGIERIEAAGKER